jgi:Uma2 family endonuclease
MAEIPLSSRFTYEDFCNWPQDGRRHEIIDGEHFASSTPNRSHQLALIHLVALLHPFVGQHQLGEVFLSPFDVLFSDFDVVQPDLVFVAKANAEIVTEDNVQGVPDLVVEILSESTRKYDLVTKRKLYERFGVPEFWVVDPLLETVAVYRHDGSVLAKVAELSAEADEQLDSPRLPGLSVSLASLFE